MRHLLHFGLFALALTAVSQASADDNADSDWRRRRGSKVTVTAQVGPRHTLPVRAKVEHRRAPYDSRWTSHERARAYAMARQNLHEQERDLERIVRISERWDRATAHHNPHAQRNVERRLDDWLREEIHESREQPYNDRYRRRLREIRRELEASNGYFAYGRGRRHRNARKAQIIDELVYVSEWQVRRARAELRRPHRLHYAYR